LRECHGVHKNVQISKKQRLHTFVSLRAQAVQSASLSDSWAIVSTLNKHKVINWA